MLADLKNTIKQSAIYGLSRISTKLVALILLPIYSLHFPIAEYGVIVRVETLWQIFWAIFLFGFESGVIRWFISIEDIQKRKIFLFTVSVFLFVFNFFLTAIIFLQADLFSLLIFDSLEYSTLIYYAAIIAALESLSFLIFLLLRIKEKAFLYSLFAILITVLNLIFQLYFILFTEMKLDGIFIAKIISPAIVMLLLLPFYFKNLKIGFDYKNLLELLKYSYPIMLATLVGTLLNQFDRYILGFLKSSSDVGVYGLAYNICGLLNFLIIGPYLLAYTIISWKKYKEENAKRFFTKNITYLFFAVTYLALILSLLIPNFIKIFTLNVDYWEAKNVVPIIAISMPFYGISVIGFFSFYVTKKTSLILYFYITALILNIVLNYVLIPSLGIYGAAIANFISFIFLTYLNFHYSRKNYFFEYEWNNIFKMIFTYSILVVPFYLIQFPNLIIEGSLKFIAFILFPIILLVLKFYEPIELETIKRFSKRIFKNKKNEI